MSPEPTTTDWIIAVAGFATALAALAAIYFARRQTSILQHQANIQDTQSDLQKQQTNLMKLQADIAKDQAEIASQQLSIIESQERNRLTESRKANLSAWTEKQPVGNSFDHYLVIMNKGPADARNITVYVNGLAISKWRSKGIFACMPDVIPQLSEAIPVRYLLSISQGVGGDLQLEIEWKDDSGEARRITAPLNFD